MKKLILILALAAGLTLLMAGVALAAGTKIPHGGYDTSTDACLQCHDVHESAGDYVLTRWNTVTYTCGSCHYLYKTNPQLSQDASATANLGASARSAPNTVIGAYYNDAALAGTTPAYVPGYAGSDVDPGGYAAGISNSVGARTSAYERDLANPANGEHNLSRGQFGTFVFNDGKVADANYIPGGFYPLTAIKRAQYGQTVPTTTYSGTAGLYCASCHTPHGNFGQLLLKSDGSMTSTKILSSKPNHNPTAIVVNNWIGEGYLWCEVCHGKRKPEAIDPADGKVYHNHPDQFCLNCHGNKVAGSNTDFPHTGELYNLLTNEPDALCVTCHVPGSLP